MFLSIFASLFFLGGLVGVWGLGVTTAYHLISNVVASYFLVWGVIWSFSKQSRGELIARFVLITASSCVAVGSLEALSFAGLVDYREIVRTSNAPEWLLPHNEFDPELLVVRKPYARASGTRTHNIARRYCVPARTYEYDIRYDRNGFRNARDISQADIALVGDSYIEGTEISDDALITTSVLQRYMNTSVANLGRAGYGPQQELAVLKRYAIPLRPKVIVWAFYEGNDLNDMHEYEKIIAENESNRGPHGSTVDRSLLNNSFRVIWELVFEPCKADLSARSGKFEKQDGNVVRVLFDDHTSLTIRDLTALDRLRDIFAEAHRVSAQHGVTLVVAFLPAKFRVHEGATRIPENSMLPAASGDLPQRIQNMLADTSPEIGFVDLTTVFAQRVRHGQSLFLEDDTHWTELGHQVAAQTLGKYLQQEVTPK